MSKSLLSLAFMVLFIVLLQGCGGNDDPVSKDTSRGEDTTASSDNSNEKASKGKPETREDENRTKRGLVKLPELGSLPDQLQTLADSLNHVDPAVRLSGIEALEKIGRNAKPTLPALEILMKGDGDTQVKIAAARAVGVIRKEVEEAGGDPDDLSPPLDLKEVAGEFSGSRIADWGMVTWQQNGLLSVSEAKEKFENWLIGSQWVMDDRGNIAFAAKGETLKARGSTLAIAGKGLPRSGKIELFLEYQSLGLTDTNGSWIKGTFRRDPEGNLQFEGLWSLFLGTGYSSFNAPSGKAEFVLVLKRRS